MTLPVGSKAGLEGRLFTRPACRPPVDRLDAAGARAERLRSYRYKTVEHILIHQQDRLPLDDPPSARPALPHKNVRGAAFYAEQETYADPSHD